jgi:hypothetical protein
MQSINFPGDTPLFVPGKKKKPNGCIGYGDFLVITFSQGAYFIYDNPFAFTKPLPIGYFDANSGVDSVLVSSPAASTDQLVTLTFYEASGKRHEYVLAVESLAKCPPKLASHRPKKKK